MHISLDSALGQQRRLNQVGETINSIATSAAAYSLRSLTGGDPKVVRVRRESDNNEQDFTASEVSSGALTSFVNAQVTPPLDIQELTTGTTNDGRNGDFLIAKAAYSLRSLGTRQATLTSSGDTDGDTSGKFVAQVRRSSDDALKSFTATEVTDGTLLSFVNQIQTVGTAVNGTGSFDNYTVSNLSTTGFSADNNAGGIGSAGFPYVFKDEDVIVVRYTVSNFASNPLSSLSPQVRGVNSISSVTGKTNSGTAFTANGTYTDTLTATADGTHLMFADSHSGSYTISAFEIVSHSSSGFVKTWYDQSVTTQAGDTATGNHATQATAAEQPKIVDAGSLITGGGIAFDGSDDQLDFTALNATDLAIFSVLKFDDVSGQERILGEDSTNSEGFGIANATTAFFRANGGSSNSPALNATISTSGDFLYSANRASNTLGFFTNGVASATATNSDAFKANSIGGHTNPIDGNVKEIIIYETDQTDNRTAIEANIGEVYSIDLPSGVDPLNNEVNGFVETWYDQSGNGRDSTQTTAARQPIIVDAGTFQDGLKFTHDDTTNGKRLSVPRSAAELGDTFALVWVGKITVSDSSYNTVLGGTRGVSSFAPGTAGLTVKSSTGNVAFINEETTTDREVSISSTTISLNTDAVIFATYEDAEAGPDLDLSVNGNKQDFGYGSNLILTSSKDIGIMHGSSSGGSYRTQESPVGICREVLAYDTAQFDNRVDLETNIINHYGIS